MNGPIVCATRGGRICRCTQEHAIELAQERDEKLIFLFIADPSFAGALNETLMDALNDELKRLGRALLYIAQDRAREQGIKAEFVVRHGSVQAGIKDYIQEVGASLLVIGATQASSVAKSCSMPPDTDDNKLPDFAKTIQQATGVQVIVMR